MIEDLNTKDSRKSFNFETERCEKKQFTINNNSKNINLI